MEIKSCYLCGSKNLNQRQGKVRDNNTLKILECLNCGLVFLSSFDHIEEKFYEKSKIHEREPEGLDLQYWIKETERDDERRFQAIRFLLPSKSLLDFGCGTGNFLLKARKIAKEVCGVEREIRLADYFKQNGLKVFKEISEIPNSAIYGIITIFHVLEHLPNPREVLIKLSKRIKEGRIIIEVPNADDALLTLYKSEAYSRFVYWSCHLFMFNRKTLELLALQANLKVDYIKQVQRYSLSNHLFWLANGKPGGHHQWSFLDSQEICTAYESQLSNIGKCDTLMASFSC